MKQGVILAGGNGTRLRPLTNLTNKHLLPVYNKPMILYPLQTLLDMGIEDILIVTGKEYAGDFIELLGSGAEYGCNFTYKVQDEAGGIAQALLLAEGFVHGRFAVILGDNVFEYPPRPELEATALIVKEVPDPQRFGVAILDRITDRIMAIEEKPKKPRSNLAVTGLYIYYPDVFDFIKTLSPSERGELEITDVNNWVIKQKGITEIIKYDGFWSDAGTFESLARASDWARKIK